MWRLLAIALFAALPAAAQVHVVPPSGTSIALGRSPSVPAGVTWRGSTGSVDPMFRPSVDPMFRNPNWVDPMFRGPAIGCSGRHCRGGGRHPGSGRHPRVGQHHRRHHRKLSPAYYYPYYYGYPAYYATPVDADEEYEPADEEPPALTIYERRSRIAFATPSEDDDRYGEHYTDYREAQRRREQEERDADAQRRRDEAARRAESRPATPPEDQEPVAVLVFKDGRRRDLQGYAITGEVVYDLSGGRAQKIQLADLDLPATIKLNDELGSDFRLPVSPPKQN